MFSGEHPGANSMISLKRYLDQGSSDGAGTRQVDRSPCLTVLEAYKASLLHMSECGVDACPDLGPDLTRGLRRITESLGNVPSADSIAGSESAVREVLRDWGRQVAAHYDKKASDVRDLLLVMSRTAESLAHKDDRIARHLDTVTAQLTSIASLDDVSRLRSSIEASARELRDSLGQMAAEGKALIEHLRAEVSTYQTKLEKEERASSCDVLTGLGSRRWVERCVQERIDSGTEFSVVLIDIDDFHDVVKSSGNLVGDLLLKEFAKELRSACRFTDIVGRWGSDEFMILFDGRGDWVRSQLARLCESISKPYHVPGRTGYVNVPLSASIGVAEHHAGDDVQVLLERADAELYRQRMSEAKQKTA